MTEEEESKQGLTGEAWLFGFGVGFVILIVMVVAYQIGFNRGEDEGGGGQPSVEKPAAPEAPPSAASGPGRELFVEECGTCHTLSAAGTTGTIGPNLDDLQPDEAEVLSAIENGGAGSGQMPAGLYSGSEAKQVADFVSGSAGK